MPLDRVTGEQFDVLVDHADGRVGICVRGPTPSRVCQALSHKRNHRRDTVGAYCLLESVPTHRASVGTADKKVEGTGRGLTLCRKVRRAARGQDLGEE